MATMGPTQAPTQPPTGMVTTTQAPPPVQAPAPSGSNLPSPRGQINVAVCISSSVAIVTLEKTVTMMSSWNGTFFPPVSFPAFNTANNAYPGLTLFGRLNGSLLDITMSDGNNESNFLIGAGSASDCVV